jgi:imidazolonepropionase-like amidohydrolase
MKPSAALAVVGALLASGIAAHAEKTDVYALVGGRVVTVSGGVLEKGTVILRDGVIEAVGPDVAPPVDARVIEVNGLTVTPGLIDGFGGVGLPAPPRRSEGAGRGEAAAPRPPAAAADQLRPRALALDKLRPAEIQKARDAGVTTALVVPKDGVVPGRSVLIDLWGDTVEGMVVKPEAALHLQMVSLTRQYPGSLMGTVAYARQALLDATRYREEFEAYERSPRGKKRPRYDPDLEAWAEVLAGRLPLMVTARVENDIRRALALADEFKIRVVLAGGFQASRLAATIKARKVPLLVSVNFDPPTPVRTFGPEDEERRRKEILEAEANPGELHKAGVSFGLVSGHAPNFLAGVRKAIDRGLPRDAALAAVTLGAAQALGVADRMGSLEAGKVANLVVWSGEPLTKEAKAKMVFVDGRLYEPEERREKTEKQEDP